MLHLLMKLTLSADGRSNDERTKFVARRLEELYCQYVSAIEEEWKVSGRKLEDHQYFRDLQRSDK